MDITDVRMHKDWMYLCAVVDGYSRKVFAWLLSNTMDVEFCVQAVQEAIAGSDRPTLFNTDQGSQLTNDAFTAQLKRHGIQYLWMARALGVATSSWSAYGDRSSTRNLSQSL